jgi:hypothetical protein
MKKLLLSTLPLLLFIGCGDASAPVNNLLEEQSPIESTKKIRALGVEFEWQTEVDSQQDWQGAQAYCANKSMRLPSPEEFFALLDTNQSIDTLFPSEIKEFWTNKSYSDTKAWKITTWSSTQTYHDKNRTLGVRCVKGEKLPQHTFTKESDSILDKDTQNNIEKIWQDDTQAKTKLLTFLDAEAYCKSREMRLPTLFELQQAVDVNFSNIVRDNFLSYWTSTPLPLDKDARLTLNTLTGAVLFSDKEARNHVRCLSTINHAPTTDGNLSISTYEDKEVAITLGGSDRDGDTTTITITKEPEHGHYINGIYKPNPNYFGTDTIFYKITDGQLTSKESKVNITILPVNDAPTADNKSMTTDEDKDIEITLSGSDPESSPLNYLILSQPSSGSVTLNGNIATYTPAPNHTGGDQFTYRVNDGSLDSNIATVTIKINAINDKPIANALALSTIEDEAKEIILSGSDIESTNLIYKIVDYPTKGRLSGSGKRYIYTPNDNISGTDSFTYLVNDGTVDSALATVTIMINPRNDIPTADNQSLETNEDTNLSITLTGSDIESSVSYEIIREPIHGELSGDAPNLIYIPNENYYGGDSFSFVTSDGEDQSNEANVTINIISINDRPIALNQDLTLDEDTLLPIILESVDVDHEILSMTFSNPRNGKLSGTAPNLTYIPDENYYGDDSFTFSVSDGEANATATITLTIKGVNDIPLITVGGDITATEGEMVSISGSATDIDGSITSYEWREGSSVLSTSNAFSKSDFTVGEHNLTFTAIDNEGDSAKATLLVTINPASSTTDTDTFTTHSLQTGTSSDKIRWQRFADMDGDGDDDIVILSQSGLHWYENSGNLASFVAHRDISTLSYMEDVQLADINGDTTIDIIFSTLTSSPNLHICTNNGNKTFSCSDVDTSFDSLSMLKIADIDGDNDKDIILSSTNSDTISWIENSAGNFSTESTISSGELTNVISLDIADFNQDGLMDIIAASNSDQNIYWFENSGSSFTTHLADNTITNIASISLADIDGDDILDNIVTSTNSNAILGWSKGDSTTSFQTLTSLPTDITTINYASGVDMDGDGDIDILTNDSGDSGKIVWYENNNSSFTEHIIATFTNRIVRVFANDLDKDGDLEIVSGDLSGNITIYENLRPVKTSAIPKTGDISDGAYGGDYNFLRDDTIEVVSDSLTGLMWQDDSAVTQGFKKWNRLNIENDCKIGIGNFTDWRFPNRHELYYLAQKGDTTLDSTFQNISRHIRHMRHIKDYWTSSPNKIYVNFSLAYDKEAISFNYTRCVRGEPITFDFIRDDTQEVVLDKKHQLMWEDGTNSEQRTTTTGWDDAKANCSNLDYLGFNDWRLPNIHELYSIFKDDGLDKAFFYRGTSSDILVSSTTYNASTDKAYGVNSSNGLDEQLLKTDTLKFRCVRDIP